MLKNRVFATLSLVALLGAAACGGDAEDEAVIEEPAVPRPERLSTDEVVVDSAVTAGAIIMDTSTVGTQAAPVDTTP